jgi:hypothetical protein
MCRHRRLFRAYLEKTHHDLSQQLFTAAAAGGRSKLPGDALQALSGIHKYATLKSKEAGFWQQLLWPAGNMPELMHPWQLTNSVRCPG